MSCVLLVMQVHNWKNARIFFSVEREILTCFTFEKPNGIFVCHNYKKYFRSKMYLMLVAKVWPVINKNLAIVTPTWWKRHSWEQGSMLGVHQLWFQVNGLTLPGSINDSDLWHMLLQLMLMAKSNGQSTDNVEPNTSWPVRLWSVYVASHHVQPLLLALADECCVFRSLIPGVQLQVG